MMAALLISGCTSTSSIDTAFADVQSPLAVADPLPPPAQPRPVDAPLPTAVESAALADDTVQTGSVSTLADSTARNTGTFPNINVEPPPAENHLTTGQSAALVQRMQALDAQLQSGRVSPTTEAARIAELERLAATHSEEVLRRIEAGE